MKQLLTFIIFICTIGTFMAQDVTRVQVSGKIIGNSDVEGVTIYNTSSNNGTVADIDGHFKIEVAVNDILEISALQYESKKVTINLDVIASKQLRLFLVEALNTLSEVILLPSTLTGEITVDIANAEVQKMIIMDFGDLGYMIFAEDEYTKPINTATSDDTFYNGVDFAALLGLNRLLNRPLKKQSIQLLRDNRPRDLSDLYTPNYIHETYKVPLSDVEAFIAYLNNNGFDEELLEPENEIQLMEFLVKGSKQFLSSEHDQN